MDLMNLAQERCVDSADLISFLLELSFLVTGKAYNINTLTDFQRHTIKDLADLRLVKLQQSRKESWFIPTKLVTNLSMSLSDTSSRKQGFVAVETNFRYAYSTSKLHSEILHLFSRVHYELANLIVAAMTKESLYSAFENGITADQDLPEDPTGRIGDFKDFINSNIEMFQWIALLIVLAQGLSILLAMVLRTTEREQISNCDSDDDYRTAKHPLLNQPGQPSAFVADDAWSLGEKVKILHQASNHGDGINFEKLEVRL